MISFQEGAYFYPKEIQQRLIELGRTDQKTIDRKRKICLLCRAGDTCSKSAVF